MKKLLLSMLFAGIAGGVSAAPATVALPQPVLPETATLAAAMQARRSTRAFTALDPAALPQLEAGLLWAANGSNRPGGQRVIPAALARYAVSVYLADHQALYRFDRTENSLTRVAEGDFLPYCAGNREMCAKASLALLLVIDETVWKERDKEEYAALEAGAIMQNVYLYCAAAGLGTVACGSFQEKPLEKALQLQDDQELFLTMLVGGAEQ